LIVAANVAYFSADHSHSKLNGMRLNPPTPHEDQSKSLRQLYPHLSDSQLEEANEILRQYVALAIRVFERLELDPEAWAHFEVLTASRRGSTMNRERPETDIPSGT